VHPHFAGVGTTSDLLLRKGNNNTRLKLTNTRTLRSGVVMLSYQVPDTERPGAQAAGR
jgi:hypothetical protein